MGQFLGFFLGEHEVGKAEFAEFIRGIKRQKVSLVFWEQLLQFLLLLEQGRSVEIFLHFGHFS